MPLGAHESTNNRDHVSTAYHVLRTMEVLLTCSSACCEVGIIVLILQTMELMQVRGLMSQVYCF